MAIKSDFRANLQIITGSAFLSVMRLKRFGLFAAGLTVTAIVVAGCSSNPSNVFQGYIEGEYVYVAVAAGRRAYQSRRRPRRFRDERAIVVCAGTRLRGRRRSAGGKESRAIQSPIGRLDERPAPDGNRLARGAIGPRQGQSETGRRRTGSARKTGQHGRDFQGGTGSGPRPTRRRPGAGGPTHGGIKTAKLGGREDAIRAAQAAVASQQAALDKAKWSFDQKQQFAPANAFVQDTLYRQGEWVAAGNPVVALLPPENLKVRFFVPETALPQIKTGQNVEFPSTARRKSIPRR